VTPAAPSIVQPARDAVVATITPTIAGTAEAGSVVRVVIDGVLVGAPTADAAGQWSVVAQRLADGPHTVTATSTDAAGNVSAEASSTFTVRLPRDGGADAGADAGTGIEDGGVDSLNPNVGLQGGGCGCTSAGDFSPFFALLAFVAWRRRALR
jgi:Bacterial Ig-like domain